ncbi:hypothetical protein F444_13999 [Phytophthora nicotianae P1976]|uniref:RXLR phytopathogen effector protein WY-domain domain-containing protein n=1 Tax=Phytophthora nicotianae P1976 TaxID=1317066 RepID=A0A080ZS27_PHYNI|nr:hypothetical protein F444_13999 [Phytophthora nicotianae P1976]
MRLVFLLVLYLVQISACSSLNYAEKPKRPDHTSIDFSKLRLSPASSNLSIQPSSLRSYKTGDEGTIKEERVGIPGWTMLDGIAYKLFLKWEVNPADIFQRLRSVRASGKLDDNKGFIQWLQYVNKCRAKRGGESWFADYKLVELLRKSKSDAELVTLFQSLRRYPAVKNLADEMQAYMILSSKSSRKIVNREWLKSGESPAQVFNILRLNKQTLSNNPLFIQWLRYTKLYRSKSGGEAFSDVDIFNFLSVETMIRSNRFGTLAESLKGFPDLKPLAKTLLAQLYQRWLKDGFSPLYIANYGMEPAVSKLKNTDPRFAYLKAYTEYYVRHHEKNDLLDIVKKVTTGKELETAIAVASKP